MAATVGKFSDKASVLGNRLVLSNQKGYEDHSGDYAHQNIAKAKQLLESIGAKMGADGIYNLYGKPLAFKVETTQENPLRDQTIATMANQVKAAGIKLTEDASADIFAGADKPKSLECPRASRSPCSPGSVARGLSSNRSIYYTKSKGGGQNYTQGGNPADRLRAGQDGDRRRHHQTRSLRRTRPTSCSGTRCARFRCTRSRPCWRSTRTTGYR